MGGGLKQIVWLFGLLSLVFILFLTRESIFGDVRLIVKTVGGLTL